MSNARIFRLPINAINPPSEAPKLISDPLDFKGSIMLLDPAHAWNEETKSLNLKNLFWSRALEVISNSNLTAVGGDNIALTTAGTGTYRKAERTSKGAVHLYYQASAGTISSTIQKYVFPAAILNHIKTSGHEFYIALSHHITLNPEGLGTNATRNQWSGITQNDTQAIYSFDTQSDKPLTAGRTFYNRVSTTTDETLGLVHRSIGTTVSIPTATNGANPMFGVGRNSNWTVSEGKPTGSILYTFYVCDLTVAGKTADEVDAIFQARQAELFSENGRYYNDSYTNPLTV